MKKILIPYDFSEQTLSVLNYGIEMAKDLNTGITLLEVGALAMVSPEVGLSAFTYENIKEDNLQALKKLSEKIKIEHPQLASVDYYSEIGDVTNEIVNYCEKYSYEFLVMGINGHGDKAFKNFIGSNAVSISHKVKCNIIIVPPSVLYKKPVNIAYACEYDANLDSLPSLEKAKKLSQLLKAQLQIIHIVPENHDFSLTELTNNASDKPNQPAVHQLFLITEKKVSESLLGMLENNMIDIIIVEPREHSFFYNFFHESVTKEMAFFSPVPVIAMQA